MSSQHKQGIRFFVFFFWKLLSFIFPSSVNKVSSFKYIFFTLKFPLFRSSVQERFPEVTGMCSWLDFMGFSMGTVSVVGLWGVGGVV